MSKPRNARKGARDDLARRPPQRTPRERILVVCEGKVTEPTYLRSFAHDARNPLIQVDIDTKHGVPLTVVKRAIHLRDEAAARAKSERDEYLRFDMVWAVVDVDDHPNLTLAANLAKEKGIEMAISSPSFELWALLHFQALSREEHRDKIREALKVHLPGYDKELQAGWLAAGYDKAVKRAVALEKESAKEQQRWRNPSTGVYRLTELIREPPA